MAVGRRDRDRHRGRPHRAGSKEAWTGPQVAWKMARGAEGAFGGKTLNGVAGLARVLRGLPARARRLPAAAVAAQPRPARAAVVLDLAALLQRRRHLHERAARLPAAGLPARPHALDRVPGPAGHERPAALAGLAAGRGDRLPGRLPDRAQRHAAEAERDRRRLLGRDRRRPDRRGPVALRPLPASTTSRSRRAARRTRTARSATACRPTAAASRRTSAATPTGPSPTSRTCPAYLLLGWEREVGRPSRRAPHLDRVRPARARAAGARRAALRRLPARRDARVRLGRLSVHAVRAQLEHQRRDPAGAAPARLPAARLGVGARGVRPRSPA